MFVRGLFIKVIYTTLAMTGINADTTTVNDQSILVTCAPTPPPECDVDHFLSTDSPSHVAVLNLQII